MKSNKIRELTLISLLSVIIAILGIIKLPGLILGTEFQMSAPIAIGICATFEFKRYIISGIIGSCINFLMGTHTILNVIVEMIFRIVGGGLIGIFGNGIIVVTTVGPVGTVFGRVVMRFITGIPSKALIISASIGMLYTAMLSYITFKLIKRITIKISYKNFILDEYKIGESSKNDLTEHISGSESISNEENLEKVSSLLIKRVINHPKVKYDFIKYVAYATKIYYNEFKISKLLYGGLK